MLQCTRPHGVKPHRSGSVLPPPKETDRERGPPYTDQPLGSPGWRAPQFHVQKERLPKMGVMGAGMVHIFNVETN